MRKIKIFTTTGIPGVIETDVTTFEGLKPLLLEQNINLESTKVLVGETKLELSENEAVLPSGDFKLFVVPVKTKSGWDDEDEEDTFIQDTLGEIREDVKQIKAILMNMGMGSADAKIEVDPDLEEYLNYLNNRSKNS
jgi:hypothetical protein